jgi:hypothetical protein
MFKRNKKNKKISILLFRRRTIKKSIKLKYVVVEFKDP